MSITKTLSLSLVALGVVLALVFAFSFTVYANPHDQGNFGGNGEAWNETSLFGGGHYVNTNNGDVRMDWVHHRFAVPGMGGHHASDEAAVQAHGNQTLVDPHDTL